MTGDEKHTPTRERGDHLAVIVLVALLALGALAFSFVKLRYGVNPTDEALHVALSWRFALGSVPVADEWSLAQFAGLLAAPFLKLFVMLRGSTDGMVAAWRVGFLLMQIALGCVGIQFFRRWFTPARSVLLALPLVVFVPWSAPTLGYNTVGSSFLAMGLLLGYDLFADGITLKRALTTAVLHMVAVFAYPTLVPLVVVYALLLWLHQGRGAPARTVLWYLAIGLSGTVVAVVLALLAGVDSLRMMALWMSSIGNQGGGLWKLITIASDLGRNLFGQPLLLVGAAVLTQTAQTIARGRRIAPAVVLALAPVLTLPLVGFFPMNWTLGFVLYYCLIGLAALVWLDDAVTVGPVGIAIVLPSAVAAVLFSYSSNNGLLNAGLGLLALFCVTQLAIVLGLQRIAQGLPNLWSRLVRFASWIAPLLALAVMVFAGRLGVYGEPALSMLTTTVDSGPYRFMVTTPEMAEHMELLEATVAEHVREDDRVLFFDDLAAGYLFTSAKPATNTPWSFSKMNGPDEYARAVGWYYESSHEAPTVIVQQLRPPFYEIEYTQRNPYIRLLQEGDYRKVSDDGVFAVYRLAE